jgi:hypothetical protein
MRMPPPFHHLMDGSVTTGRYQVAFPLAQRIPGGLRGVTGVGRQDDAVTEPFLFEDALDLGERQSNFPAPRPWVSDQDKRAERAGHGWLR